jgi:hypothetical protein
MPKASSEGSGSRSVPLDQDHGAGGGYVLRAPNNTHTSALVERPGALHGGEALAGRVRGA